MEKEIEIPVAGEGNFDVVMSDFGSCEAGELTRATVAVNEEAGIQPQADSDRKSFDITINNKNAGGTRNSHYQQDDGSDMSRNYGNLY